MDLSSWRRKIRALGGRADFESQLLWILGSPRSGSTWVLQMLGKHEAVVPINEPLLGWSLGPFLSDLPGWNAGDLDSSNFTLERVRRDNANSFFSREFSDVWAPALGNLILERFRAHALRYPSDVSLSRTIVAIKEPNGSQSADLFMAAVPRSRFLFLLRDGRDVVDSDLAANLRGGWYSKAIPGARGISETERLEFVNQSAHKWLWRTEVVQEAYRAHAGPKHLMRYEDLLSDPMTHMRSLLEWIELDVDEAQLAAWVERQAFERIRAENRGPQAFYRAAQPGLWRESLTAEEQAVIEAVIGPKVRELGYDT
jgi:hypothetical protein